LVTTRQSLGGIYLRLEQFSDVLIFQKKHIDLARDDEDLVEQQRASTQLSRIHHEPSLRPEHNHKSIRNHAAMDLALDNLHEAENILRRGSKICDEERICEHDDGSII
jgi:hypothetical protein